MDQGQIVAPPQELMNQEQIVASAQEEMVQGQIAGPTQEEEFQVEPNAAVTDAGGEMAPGNIPIPELADADAAHEGIYFLLLHDLSLQVPMLPKFIKSLFMKKSCLGSKCMKIMKVFLFTWDTLF